MWCHRSRPFRHDFNFESDADFGSELPFSVQEGDLSKVGHLKVYSDRVENTLLDLFYCIMAQSRTNSSQPQQSSSWESVHPPPRRSLTVPDLDSFVSALDPLADSKVLLEEEWHSLSVNTPRSYLNPVPNLNHFVRNIDPLLYFRVSQLDFTLSSAPANTSVHYNSDPMSKHVFLTKSEQSHLPIVIDTGASRSISPCKKDFISFERYSLKIEGIGSSTAVAGKGYVKWKITDQHDKTREIVTFAYYIPSASIRLYSPQSHFAELESGKLSCTWDEVRLYLPSTTDDVPTSHKEMSMATTKTISVFPIILVVVCHACSLVAIQPFSKPSSLCLESIVFHPLITFAESQSWKMSRHLPIQVSNLFFFRMII